MVSVWVATDQWEETSVQTMWSCLGCFWLTCWSQTLMIYKTRTQLCLAQQDMIVNMIHCVQRCCALKCLVYIATCSLSIIRLYLNTSGWMQILWSKWFLLMKNVVWSMWGSIIIVQLSPLHLTHSSLNWTQNNKTECSNNTLPLLHHQVHSPF